MPMLRRCVLTALRETIHGTGVNRLLIMTLDDVRRLVLVSSSDRKIPIIAGD